MAVGKIQKRIGKDEEEMAVHLRSNKDLNLGFTTFHTMVTVDRTLSKYPLPSNFTSHF